MSGEQEQCGTIKNDGEPCTFTPKYDDGKCGIHSDQSGTDQGRDSKFDDCKDDLLEAADSYLNHEQIANAGGVVKQTMYNWFDEHQGFLDSFKRVRADAAQNLIKRGLDPEDDVDMKFVQFLLERSFKFIKTERKEHEHSGPDGGPIKVHIGGDGE